MRITLKFMNIPALVVFIAIGALVCIISTAVQADINDGIIAAWTFDDGKVTDSVGENHGTLEGGAKISQGKFGQALDVDGKTAYASVKLSDDIEKSLEKQFSVGYWIFVRNGGNHSGVWKGEKVGWGAFYTFRIVTTSSTGVTWGTCNGGAGGSENYFATDGAIEPNKWIYLCQTVDGTQAIGYVTKDGEQKPTIPPSGQGNPKASVAPYNLFPKEPLEMGRGRSINGTVGNDTYLDGLIDDVVIWNRALTENVSIKNFIIRTYAVGWVSASSNAAEVQLGFTSPRKSARRLSAQTQRRGRASVEGSGSTQPTG